MILQFAFALYPLCLAGVAVLWTLTIRPQGKYYWLLDVAAGGSIVAFAFLAGSWAFTSFYLRYVLLGVFAVVVFHSCRRTKASGTVEAGYGLLRLTSSALIFILFVVLNALAVASRLGSGNVVSLSFPLAEGTYYVLQGGNSIVTNPFHALGKSMQALDIVKLNAFGNRASGISPVALDDYEIYGETLYSPCAGTVLAVRDNLLDNAAGKPDTEHPEGNYVLIQCDKAEILVAHMMQGSAVVAVGEALRVNQALGKVGNSGNSLEPHLHIGASQSGVDMPLVFHGRRLTLNSVVRESPRDAQSVAPAGAPRAHHR